MSLALAILVTVGFLLVAHQVGLPRRAKEAGTRARASLGILSDPSLDDDSKERRLRAEALRLFALSGQILLGFCAAIGVPLAGLWGLDVLGLASAPATLGVLVRVDFVVSVCALGTAGYWVLRRIPDR